MSNSRCCRFVAGFDNSRLSTKLTVLIWIQLCRQCIPGLSHIAERAVWETKSVELWRWNYAYITTIHFYAKITADRWSFSRNQWQIPPNNNPSTHTGNPTIGQNPLTITVGRLWYICMSWASSVIFCDIHSIDVRCGYDLFCLDC